MAKHPYASESKSLLKTLNKHGLEPYAVHNDGCDTEYESEAQFLDEMMGSDECWLRVKWKTGRKAAFLLIYGNSPGELAADWTCPEDTPEMMSAMDKAIDEHAAKYGM